MDIDSIQLQDQKSTPEEVKVQPLPWSNPQRICRTLFGYVYRVLWNQEKDAALKISYKSLIREKNRGERVTLEDPIREMDVLKRIRRGDPAKKSLEGIVETYDILESDEFFAIVSEYMTHGELFYHVQNRYDQKKPFSEVEARVIFRQLLTAVDNLHQLSICHLDISLENIMLSLGQENDAPIVKLTDFGMARIMMPDKLESNLDVMKPGKQGYLAPEVFLGRSFSGVAADLFSVGVCLYIVMLGTFAFEKASRQCPRYCLIGNGRLVELMQHDGVVTRWSAELQDLLCILMNPDPVLRTSASAILKHKWFSQ